MNFEQFWQAYPRRVAKGAAKRSWDKLEKMGTDLNAVVEGAKRYALQRRGQEQAYTAHPATWLNAQRWLDDSSAVEPDEPAYEQDQKAVSALKTAINVLTLKQALIERTREYHSARIREAARRLNITEPALWGCLTPGFDGVESRAYEAAYAHVIEGKTAPSALPITQEHWLSARDRHLSRERISSQKAIFSGHGTENDDYAVHSATTEGNYAEAEDQGMA